MEALKRIRSNTVEKRLLDAQGRPAFNISFYVVNAKGEHAGVSMYGVSGGRAVRYAVCTDKGPETVNVEGLYAEGPARA
jgi:N4-(beta-N-acetylglucosaminyl)-L-asparaginase